MSEDRAQKIAELESKLRARRGQPGWEHNCKSIEAKIAELKAETK